MAVLGRNSRTGLQVWSASHGYPGEADYREFHKRDGVSGLQYWRVSGPDVDLGEKGLWNPDHAAQRVSSHADHFAALSSSGLGIPLLRANSFEMYDGLFVPCAICCLAKS